MERNLLKFIWKNSWPQQLWLVAIIVGTMPLYFLTLELPKRIVNGPIEGTPYADGATQTFLPITLPYGEAIFGRPIVLFGGLDLGRTEMLIALCLLFLGSVLLNGYSKLYVSTYKGRLGERILRRLRYSLFDRVLRYPTSRYRSIKGSEVSSVIKDEVEPLGEFIGDAFSMPLLLGSQAITGLLFLFLQNIYFGFLTIGVVAIQVVIVPKLRVKLIQLGRQRQQTARVLSGQVAEVVDNISDFHANDTTNFARARISWILTKIFNIRFDIYQRKFAVKYINNQLIQFLAFLFYIIGGYFVITGRLDIGQLVAVIAAYKDLPTPIKGLIDYDQLRMMNEARYEQTVQIFDDEGLADASLQAIPDKDVPRMEKGYAVSGLMLAGESGETVVEDVSFESDKSEAIAIVSDPKENSMVPASLLAAALGRTVPATSGTIRIDGTRIDDMPESVTGRRIGYVDGATSFPAGTIYDNLTMVLKSQPPVDGDGKAIKRIDPENPPDEAADWIDRLRIGLATPEELRAHIQTVLDRVELTSEVRDLGLRGTIDPEEKPELAAKIVELREKFIARAQSLHLAGIVEAFDPDRYNEQSSIGENLLFGTALDPDWAVGKLGSNPDALAVLKDAGLDDELYGLGIRIAETNVELFGDLPEDSRLFETVATLTFEEVRGLKEMLGRQLGAREGEKPKQGKTARDKGESGDNAAFIDLALSYVEAANRFGIVDDELEKRIIAARGELRDRIEKSGAGDKIDFYDPRTYNSSATLLDNILFGRIAAGKADARERIFSAVQNMVGEEGLSGDVLDVGLAFEMGNGGKRLSESARQKLNLARGLLKRPDMLILNNTLSLLDPAARQRIIQGVIEARADDPPWQYGIFWVPGDLRLTCKFDRVLMLERGRLREDDSPAALMASYPELNDPNGETPPMETTAN